MKWLRAIFGGLTRWFLDPIRLEPVAACRVLLGLSLLLAYLLRIHQFSLLYGPDSVATFGPFRSFFPLVYSFPYTKPFVHWGSLAAGTERFVVAAVYVGLLVSALAFTVGQWTRTSGALLLFCHLFLLSLDPFAYWGWSQMILPILFFTVVAPSGRCLSLDVWWRRRRGKEPRPRTASAWPVRLIQLHVAAMYAEAGFSRLDDSGWRTGVMLHHALINRHFSRFDIDWDVFQGPLRVLCVGVFLLEPAAPFLLWIPRVRMVIVGSLIAMHLGLESLVRVGFWNGTLIAALLTFLPIERWLPSRRSTNEPGNAT